MFANVQDDTLPVVIIIISETVFIVLFNVSL